MKDLYKHRYFPYMFQDAITKSHSKKLVRITKKYRKLIKSNILRQPHYTSMLKNFSNPRTLYFTPLIISGSFRWSYSKEGHIYWRYYLYTLTGKKDTFLLKRLKYRKSYEIQSK